MRTLSKSRIIAYRQCPKRLWLEIHRPELRDDSGNEAVFAIGNRVGETARRIYDPGNRGLLIDVDSLGREDSRAQTVNWLEAEAGPLFEGVLRLPGALALADVMLPETDGGAPGWRMVEVKASASLKDHHRDDLAVQAYVAAGSGVTLTGAAVAHVDTSFVYPGGGDYRGLLVERDLTGEVEAWISGARATAALRQEPGIETGPHCGDPFPCPFHGHCSAGRPQAEYPLTSFHRLYAGRRQALEAEGREDLRTVPDEGLSAVNRRIKASSRANEP